ncbi:MAG TPA: hypothetical protein VNU71_19980 [Burkholderiaceae bacterium]|nr:hypothetical protein [Burkholderiaceae bacterium]
MFGSPRRYHRRVSRLVIMFMIVLLPLRGWAGDLMSVQMATGGLASHAASGMPADCPMHATADAAQSSPAPAGMDGCTSCDLCVPMAELSSTRFDVVAFATQAAPLTGGIAFVSAAPAPALKPPIS